MKVRFIIFIAQIFFLSVITAQTTLTFTSSGSWVVPCGVTSVQVRCWGGGGAGGGANNTAGPGGSGGGGGGYCTNTLAVTPGATINYVVGLGGTGSTGNGGAGGNTTFSTVVANGGTGGRADGGLAGTGGGGSGGTVRTGGAGSISLGTSGGGGGSSAGTLTNGNAAVGTSGATAPLGGGNGGNGGATGVNGSGGAVPGGAGGGGGRRSGGSENGGSGGRGQIVIIFTPNPTSGCEVCTAIPISSFPYTYTGTTVGFNNFLSGGCIGNYADVTGNGNDMFFALTVAANSHYTIQLTGTSASNIMEVAVISANGDCASGPFTCVTNGSWQGGLQTTGTTLGSTSAAASSPCRKVWFETAGTYYLKVDAGLGVSGAFTLNVDQISAASAYGDQCTTAIGMTGGISQTINDNNCTYSTSATDPTSASTPPASTLYCAGSIENTVWLEFQSDGLGTPVSVDVNSVNCSSGYMTYSAGPPAGYAFYGASGQFGIFTSSTGACGGTYAAATTCQSLATGATYTTTLPNSAPTTYFLVWDGNGGAECNFTLTVTNVVPLPVEILSFGVQKEAKSNLVSWETTSEINLSHFVLESSLDGVNYSQVKTITAQGNSSKSIIYEVEDADYLHAKKWYRLKSVNFDGESTTHPVKMVERNVSEEGWELNIFPNPSEGNVALVINSPFKQDLDLNVVNVLGEILYHQKIACSEGLNQFNFDLNELPSGVYHVNMISSDVNHSTRLIIKD